jgi:hypothetical protein
MEPLRINPARRRFPVATSWLALAPLALLLGLAGCASTGDSSSGTASPNKFTTTDGRTIDIGRSRPADGGLRFDNPHLEKGKCWVADRFDFNGYDTIYIAPATSTAKLPDKPEDKMVHDAALERLVTEMALKLRERKLAANVVTREADLKPGVRTLRLAQTVTEFSKGGGAARYFAGLYGAGQPVLRVEGRMTAGDQTVFTFEGRRSGASGGARMGGGFMKDEDIQIEDVRSLVLDVTDFMAAIAGKYQPKN